MDPIDRQAAIELIKNYCENGCDIAEDNWCPSCQREQFIKLLKSLPSAQPDMAENLYLYKCYITDKDGLQHEVIHTGDIRRVTGWMI